MIKLLRTIDGFFFPQVGEFDTMAPDTCGLLPPPSKVSSPGNIVAAATERVQKYCKNSRQQAAKEAEQAGRKRRLLFSLTSQLSASSVALLRYVKRRLSRVFPKTLHAA